MEEKKQIVLNALAELLREQRGAKSQFIFSSENDISISIINSIERGLKDPQLTTFLRIAEACNMPYDKFLARLVKKLPKDFCFIDK